MWYALADPEGLAHLWFFMPKTLIFLNVFFAPFAVISYKHNFNRNMAKTR